MDDGLNTELLRASVYPALDDSQAQRFAALSREISDWSELIRLAEANALSALLYHHFKQLDFDIPPDHEITLKALCARHIRNNRERRRALKEILARFSALGIEVMVLKGMALIHTLYENSAQRPMGDIDLLVPLTRTGDAQKALRELGYHANEHHQGFMRDHHHLPVASKPENGLLIQVEIHHDALSGDVNATMQFETLKPDSMTIDVDGQPGIAPGPQDMLRHLCHHTFEPIETIKLGAIADIYGYACSYRNQIDWQRLGSQYPFVINALRCLHFLAPLPRLLEEHIEIPVCPQPDGVGKGFPTLSSVLSQASSPTTKLSKCFACSAWWLHVFYSIPPEKPITITRWITHPLTVTKWMLRRVVARLKS